jgi:hypothetical protein
MSNNDGEQWLFEVVDVFKITGAGLIVAVDLSKSDVDITVGEELLFLCADGSEIVTILKSIPMISRSIKIGDGTSKRLTSLELPQTEETKRITSGAQVFRRLG